VSPILPLEDDVTLTSELEKVKQFINAKQTIRCGGHIHVSDEDREPNDILLDIAGYVPLLYAMYPKRIKRDYCAVKYWGSYGHGHRQAFNVNRDTLEFRMFPSPKNMGILWFRIKLLRIMLNNTQRAVADVVEMIADKESELGKLLRTVYDEEKIKRVMSLTMKYSVKFRNSRPAELVELSKKKQNSPDDYIVDMALRAIGEEPTLLESRQSTSV
jgi:hypothetical protein